MSDEIPDVPSTNAGEERQQASEQLFAQLYAELRRLADRELHRHPAASVSPTTLVHEAYVNVAGRDAVSFTDRGKFLSYIARAMRGVLIDLLREQKALKRGGAFHITRLTTQAAEQLPLGEELARLSVALEELTRIDPRLAEVVDLKYFCGFSFGEIATLRGISERTVQRDWEKARLLLYSHLDTKGSCS